MPNPQPRPRTSAPADVNEHIAWACGFLTGDAEVPALDVDKSPSHEAIARSYRAHVTPDWVSPYQLVGQFELIRRANKRQPYPPDRIEVLGDSIRLRDHYGHHWHLRFSLADDGRIAGLDVDVELAGGLTLRDAQPADYGAVERIDRAAPLPLDGGVCHVDRRGTTATSIRLLGEGSMKVVELDGEVAALCGAAHADVRIGGREYRVTYSHHARAEEPVRGRGLLPVMAASGEAPTLQVTEGVISVAVADNIKAASNQPFLWKAGACRMVFDCSEIAGPAIGRTIDPTDAPRICDLINGAHGGQEWFRPYTPEVLDERLSRAPDDYGWQSFRATDEATVGIWMSGERRHYVFEDRDWTEVRANVLDYGFSKRGLADFEALLRSAAADALAAGITHLSIFTSEPAPAHSVLPALAQRIEPYVVSCSIPEPEGAEGRGVYIDATFA